MLRELERQPCSLSGVKLRLTLNESVNVSIYWMIGPKQADKCGNQGRLDNQEGWLERGDDDRLDFMGM